MSSFDSNGNYNKTNWKTGDKITADKLNKIEESLEIINNNDIERHKEVDERLDALEEQKEVIEEELNNKATKDEVHDRLDVVEGDINIISEELNSLTPYISDFEDLKDMIENSKNRTIHLKDCEFILYDTINIPEDVTIIGYNTVIKNINSKPFFRINSNVTIKGVNFISDKTSYTAKCQCLQAVGEYDNFIENIRIENCSFTNIGNTAIDLRFVKNSTIRDCKFKNIGYAGVGCTCVKNILIENIYINTLYGDQNEQCYGVYFSRFEYDDFIESPPSENCTVKDSYIENSTTWEGLDTHGGTNIKFINNTIKNCKVGIVIGGSQNSSGIAIKSPEDCYAEGNHLENIAGYGISVGQGATMESYNLYVTNNILKNCGEYNVATTGSIRVAPNAKNVFIENNIIIEPIENGIVFGVNTDVEITNNIIRSLKGTGSVQYAINMLDTPAKARIIGNRVNGSGTVATNPRAFRVTGNDNEVTFRDNIAINGIDNTTFGTSGTNMAGIRLMSGLCISAGIAEPTMSAPNGSIYLRTQGEEGSTFYIRINDEWVPKF